MIAFEAGRPISGQFSSSYRLGLETTETDIFLVNVDDDLPPSALMNPILSNIQTRNPRWSPGGEYLSFVWIEFVPTRGRSVLYEAQHYVGLWSRKSGETKKIARISSESYYNEMQVHFWMSPSVICVAHNVDMKDPVGTSQIEPLEVQMDNLNSVRFNGEHTAQIFDSTQTDPDFIDEKKPLANLCFYDVESSDNYIFSSAHEVTTELVVSHKSHFGVAFSADILAMGDTPGFSDNIEIFQLLDSKNKNIFRYEISTFPYVVRSQDFQFSQDGLFLWGMFWDVKRGVSFFGSFDLTQQKFKFYDDFEFAPQRFSSFHMVELNESNVIYFRSFGANKNQAQRAINGGTQAVPWEFKSKPSWFRFFTETEKLENVSDDDSDPLECDQIELLAKDVALGVGNQVLYRYENLSGKITQSTIELGGANKQASYKFVRSISWVFSEGAKSPVIVRESYDGMVKYYLTFDGCEFLSMDIDAAGFLLGFDPISGEMIFLENGYFGTSLKIRKPNLDTREITIFNPNVAAISPTKTTFFTSHFGDGRALYNEVIFPPKSTESTKKPCVVVIYPDSQYPPHVSTYVHSAQYPMSQNLQIFAQCGYVVLRVATPLEWYEPKRDNFFEYVYSLVDNSLKEAERLEIIDRRRVFLKGHSWGASTVLGLLEYYPNDFLGAIASSGSYNDLGWYGQFNQVLFSDKLPDRDLISVTSAHYCLGTTEKPWEIPKKYIETSLILDTNNIVRPILLVHGEMDFIPVSFAEQIYTALREQNKQVRFLRFGGEGHIISSINNIRKLWVETIKFLEQNDKSSL